MRTSKTYRNDTDLTVNANNIDFEIFPYLDISVNSNNDYQTGSKWRSKQQDKFNQNKKILCSRDWAWI